MSTLRVNVMAYEAPCERCVTPMPWVFGLLPAHRPRAEEYTTTDFPGAVDVARRILTASAAGAAPVGPLLNDRPTWQRGRGFNPNTCRHCGHQAEWHTLDAITDDAYYGGWTVTAEGRVPVGEWRAICGQGQGIAWPALCDTTDL